jgi:hypothetical protein
MEVHYSFFSTSVRESIWKSIVFRSRDFTTQECSNSLLGLANMQFAAAIVDIKTMKSIKERIAYVKASEFTIQV